MHNMRSKLFPKLYASASTGKQKEWQVSVHECGDGTCAIRRTHGFTNCQMQTSDKKISAGKNIGRANETTIFEQAVFEAQSLWNKKKDSAYTEDLPKETDNVLLPMLALDFRERKHNIKYPCYAQPKLNGVRVFCHKIDESTIKYTSRKGKEYTTIHHFDTKLLKALSVGDIADGEVYLHGMDLQDIVSLVKKWQPETLTLKLYLYDKAEPKVPFYERIRWLEKNLNVGDSIVVVPTTMVLEESDVYDWHNDFVQAGYEGVIIRNRESLYKFIHRSKDLQKYKEFIDEEFTIVGGKPGTGLHEGCVIFICDLGDGTGRTFEACPKGTLAQRREWYKNIKDYIGKKLTVRYLERSKDNIPIGNTVGIVIRDYE